MLPSITKLETVLFYTKPWFAEDKVNDHHVKFF